MTGGVGLLVVVQDGKRKRKKRKGKHQQLMEEWDELGKVGRPDTNHGTGGREGQGGLLWFVITAGGVGGRAS